MATVLQPGKAASQEAGEKARLALIVLGMVVPVIISAVVGHEH